MPKYQIIQLPDAKIPTLREVLEPPGGITHVQVGDGIPKPVVGAIEHHNKQLDYHGEVVHEFEAAKYFDANEVWKQWVIDNVPGMEGATWHVVVPNDGFTKGINSETPEG